MLSVGSAGGCIAVFLFVFEMSQSLKNLTSLFKEKHFLTVVFKLSRRRANSRARISKTVFA